jgi:hypothetical protein
MAEEAIELIGTIMRDAEQHVTSVDTAKLARLHAVLLDAESGSSMIAARSDIVMSLPQQLVDVINSPIVSAKNRFCALGILVALSRTPDDHYRSHVLLPAVVSLDASFEGLLVDKKDANRQYGTSLGKPHEHLVVLLLRVTNYTQLKAADLLQQLCDNDDNMLAMLLLDIVRVKTYEWPLLVAALRCLFELSLPQTYFSADMNGGASGNEVVEVNSFQQKITGLLVHFMQGNTLRLFGDELTERFTMCLKQPLEVVVASLPHFATALKYFTAMLLNLEDFCDKPPLQKTYQQSMLVHLSSTITDFITAFVVTAVSYSPLLIAPATPDAALMCSGLHGCVKVIRFAFYKVRSLPPHFITALSSLMDCATNRIVVLRQPPLIPVLLCILETMVNVDAMLHDELSLRMATLLNMIAADATPCGPHVSLSQTLSTLFLNETSVFATMDNETVRAMTSALCGAALDNLVDEIIQYIDRELILLGLGQAVFDFFIPPSDPQDLVFVPPPSGPEAISQSLSPSALLLSPTAAPTSPSLEYSVPPTDTSPPKKAQKIKSKKSSHPASYVCMLTGKLMREPVVLRNGNRFELEALEKIMETMGHVDPISGDVFSEDPEVDMRLQQEIQQYKISKAAGRRHRTD